VEPPRVVLDPIDLLQRHAYNLGIAAASAAPQQLLGKRIAADAFAPRSKYSNCMTLQDLR
jgi:hypothetical protein